jgi:hypothetical protein
MCGSSRLFKCQVKTIVRNESEKKIWILKTGDFPIIQNIMETIFSIPLSNGYCERIFSLIGIIWTDPRNKLKPENVKAELIIYLCEKIETKEEEFLNFIISNKPLLRVAQSNKKYALKNKNKVFFSTLILFLN